MYVNILVVYPLATASYGHQCQWYWQYLVITDCFHWKRFQLPLSFRYYGIIWNTNKYFFHQIQYDFICACPKEFSVDGVKLLITYTMLCRYCAAFAQWQLAWYRLTCTHAHILFLCLVSLRIPFLQIWYICPYPSGLPPQCLWGNT